MEKLMFQKIFTTQQLTSFFQIAVLMDIVALLLDLLIYHFFPNNYFLDILAINLNNASIIIIYGVLASQAIIIFIENHQKLYTQYKLLAITIELFIGVFLFSILKIDNDIKAKFIIFSSSLSLFNHSYKLIFLLLSIFIMLLIDFYHNLKTPTNINNESVLEILRSTCIQFLRKHLLIIFFIFGIVHFKKIHRFSVALFHHSQLSLFYDLQLLEIIIPIFWFGSIAYYFYQRFQLKSK
jgi:hypothetical protein